MFNKVGEYINKKLVEGKHIPYIDIIVKKNHETLYRYMNGFDHQPTGKEMLYMYSCTKPLTAVCAMRLLQEGKLSLEDEVAQYLPEYKNVFLLGENAEHIKPKNKMKIKHLLTMTAGLTYDRDTSAIKEIQSKTKEATTRQIVSAFAQHPLAFEPGTNYLYSLCLDVLGAVIEVVSGVSFAEYVQKVVFSPLGMKNCGFNETVFQDKIIDCYRHKAGVYTVDKERFYITKLSKNYESGGGGLISAVEDYSIFADTLACNGVSKEGYQLLNKSYIDLMRSEHVPKKDFIWLGEDYGYGFGVRTRKKALECGVPVGEFGWDGAAGSYVLIDTKNNISITIGMNLLDAYDIYSGEHLNIVKLIYESLFDFV